MSQIRYQWSRLSELTSLELHRVIAAREEVFIVEQNCALQLEADPLNEHAWHLIAWSSDVVAGYLRVVDPGFKYQEPSIGRVLTTKQFRGSGLGRKLMEEALRNIQSVYPNSNIRISAQLYLEKFYADFGFIRSSDEYLEDDIPHIEMIKDSSIAIDSRSFE